MLTSPKDPRVVDALTRKCSACDVKKGDWCVCFHKERHELSTCPTATGRLVHHARTLPTPKGGD